MIGPVVSTFFTKHNFSLTYTLLTSQEIGLTHMKIVQGLDSLLQLSGLVARLCLKSLPPDDNL